MIDKASLSRGKTMATRKPKVGATMKSSVQRRLRLVKGDQQPTAAFPGSEQDTRRRLGNFTGAGEHARVGGRTSGIVGQTTKRSRTDKAKRAR
jgi:hypothetical protein